MTTETVAQLKLDLIRDEGVRLTPYLDCCGKGWRECSCATKGYLTIGIGRNLDALGITREEAEFLLAGDIKRTVREQAEAFPWTLDLSLARQRVIANMLFNMGLATLKQFKNTLAAMRNNLTQEVINGMLASKWARQVGARATRLAKLWERG